MRTPLILLAAIYLFTGCVGGPTKTFYNPVVTGAKFRGPVVVNLVDDAKTEAEKLVAGGYTVVGTTSYTGTYAQSKELIAQAKRAGANRVVYHAKYVPPVPGQWSFRFGQGFGSGGTGGGMTAHYIVFLGK